MGLHTLRSSITTDRAEEEERQAKQKARNQKNVTGNKLDCMIDRARCKRD